MVCNLIPDSCRDTCMGKNLSSSFPLPPLYSQVTAWDGLYLLGIIPCSPQSLAMGNSLLPSLLKLADQAFFPFRPHPWIDLSSSTSPNECTSPWLTESVTIQNDLDIPSSKATEPKSSQSQAPMNLYLD